MNSNPPHRGKKSISGELKPEILEEVIAKLPAETVEGNHFIVGIGASAGGLEALRILFKHLSMDTGASFVVAQHLSPSHRSMLVQLLAAETTLPIKEVEDGEIPKPNTIYITPANHDASFTNGKLKLSKPSNPVGPKPSVDLLFSSLAEVLGESAMGVILSGTGSDGANGVRAIKAAGGFVLVQDEATAKYNGMPRAAVETRCADMVLPLERMAAVIASLVKVPHSVGLKDSPKGNALKNILQLVYQKNGVDFSSYKETTVRRRVARRMAANRMAKIEDYEQFLQTQPEEIERLCRDILISVTSFFRDKPAFAALGRIIAQMIDEKPNSREIRVWVPGCATGEEAYSIAILIAEHLGSRLSEYKVQLFATDLDVEALACTRKAIFSENAIEGLDEEYVKKYFVKNGSTYQVAKFLREMLLIARQDLVQDPPFLRLDLISCRNVLIYFNNDLQNQIFDTFHYALNPDGTLFLGKSETVGQHDNFFQVIDKKWKIYRRKAVAQRGVPRFPSASQVKAAAKAERSAVEEKKSPEDLLLSTAVAKYVPSGLLINGNFNIQYVHGDVSDFITISKGVPSLNTLDLIRANLKNELRALLSRARRDKAPIYGHKHHVATGENGKAVRMALFPVDTAQESEELFLLCFEEFPTVEAEAATQAQPQHLSDQPRIELLEQDLTATREHLQMVVEELETANEELQSLNEEMQASNEELQTSNEELQTSNEELHSSNEELTTVNEELQIKTVELTEANEDLQNIQANIDFPLLVVDRNCRVMRYNEAATHLFSLNGGARELITSLPSNIELPALGNYIKEVIQSGIVYEEEVGDGKRYFLMRIRPYYSQKKQIEGAVIVFADNTRLKSAELELRESQGKLSAILNNATALVFMKDTMGRYLFVNTQFEKLLNLEENFAIGKTDEDVLSQPTALIFRDKDLEVLKSRRDVQSEDIISIGNQQYNFLSVRFPLYNADKTIYAICTIATDITAHKQAIAGRERAEKSLLESEQQFKVIFESANDGMLLTDGTFTKIFLANHLVCQMLGCETADLLQKPYTDIFPPERTAEIIAQIEKAAEGETIAAKNIPFMSADGTPFYADVTASKFQARGQTFILQIIRDTTERMRMEDILFEEKGRAQVTLECIADGVITTDSEGMVEYLNPVAEQLTGWSRAHAYGRPLSEVYRVIDEASGNPRVYDITIPGPQLPTNSANNHTLLIRRDGTEFSIDDSCAELRDRDGRLIGAVIVFHDVTQIQALTRQLAYQASHDALTGLVNRREFEGRLTRALKNAQDTGAEHAFCYVDLDQFKVVNDTCGHVAGDELLHQVSLLLFEKMRKRDTLARLGGDEFGILLERCTMEKASEIANEVKRTVKEYRFLWEGKVFSIGASIGVVAINKESDSVASILSSADAACYTAKEKGRDRVHIYAAGDAEMARRYGQMEWVSRITHALEQGRFQLFGHAIVPLANAEGPPKHYEVLVRMLDEQGTLVPPGAFIPAAERYNLMPAIDRWVLAQVFTQYEQWISEGATNIPMCSINLSGDSLNDPGLLDYIRKKLVKHNIPPEVICFEITETVAIANFGPAAFFIKELKDLGCRFMLDDFGSGMSSFAYLKNLAVDYLKIDGNFVRDIVDDPIDRALVEAINRVGSIMEIQTIAEYVENDAILQELREIGVDFAQGYSISKPEPLFSLVHGIAKQLN